MVSVAQLAEHRVVAPVVEGSSPFTHPIFSPWKLFDFRAGKGFNAKTHGKCVF